MIKDLLEESITDHELVDRSRPARRWGLYIGSVSLVIAVVLVLVSLSKVAWDPLGLARIGTYWAYGEPYPTGTNGYDGQFYYQIAVHGIRATPYLDNPSFRFMRILYPLLARGLGLGSSRLIPWMLILINILSYAIGTGMFTYMLVQYRGLSFFGLGCALWIGSIITLLFDLTELLCLVLALGGILAYKKGDIWTAMLLIFGSAFAKEIGLVFGAALAFHAMMNGKKIFDALRVFVLPTVIWIVWAFALGGWLGEVPFQYESAHFGLPLQGFMMIIAESSSLFVIAGVFIAFPIMILFALGVKSYIGSRKINLTSALLFAMIVFIATMPELTWIEPVAALRVSTPFIISGMLFLAENYPRLLPFGFGIWSTSSLLLIFLFPHM
jgi:hypothetical protein